MESDENYSASRFEKIVYVTLDLIQDCHHDTAQHNIHLMDSIRTPFSNRSDFVLLVSTHT